MENVYDLILMGFQNIMNWMQNIEYFGINLLQVSFFAFFITLIWQLILAPVIGNRSGGSLSVGLSDVRTARLARNDRRERKERSNKKSKG